MASRTLRQRKLARAVREARLQAGLTARELAKLVRMQESSISKIENLKQTVVPRTLMNLLSACGVGAPLAHTLLQIAEEAESVAWWDAYDDTVPDFFRDYVDLESDAEQIWTYCPELVTGLAQTGDYADAILRLNPSRTPVQRERAVAFREGRQEQLDRANPPRLRILLNEAVVRRPVGGTEVMRAQLQHLADMSRRPNISIQLLPFSAGEHALMQEGAHTLLRFPGEYEDMDCVYKETNSGSLWKERPVEVAAYASDFDATARMALSSEKTRALLTSLGGETTWVGTEGSTDGHSDGHPLEEDPLEDK